MRVAKRHFKKLNVKIQPYILLNSVRTVKINHYGSSYQKIELVEDGLGLTLNFPTFAAPYILNYNKTSTR